MSRRGYRSLLKLKVQKRSFWTEVSFFHVAIRQCMGRIRARGGFVFLLRKILPGRMQVWRFFKKNGVPCHANHALYLCNEKRE